MIKVCKCNAMLDFCLKFIDQCQSLSEEEFGPVDHKAQKSGENSYQEAGPCFLLAESHGWKALFKRWP